MRRRAAAAVAAAATTATAKQNVKCRKRQTKSTNDAAPSNCDPAAN